MFLKVIKILEFVKNAQIQRTGSPKFGVTFKIRNKTNVNAL